MRNSERYALDAAALKRAALKALHQQDAPLDASLTVVVTNDAAVRALNLQYRHIDAPTDVLSFPAEPLPEGIGEGAENYLGDLVIAYPYASTQAARLGHALMGSLALLVVHGTLHLLGHDHDTPERRSAMWAAQEHILRLLGIDTGILPALEGDRHD